MRREPVSRDPWTGELVGYYTGRFERVLGNDESGGSLAVMRSTVRPGTAPPLHIHTREDESWVVLSGTVRFWLGGRTLDACRTVDVGPGGYVFGPRMVPHTFATVTPESEVLISNTPGDIEGYFTGVGAADDRQDEAHSDLHERYGLEIFFDQVPVV